MANRLIGTARTRYATGIQPRKVVQVTLRLTKDEHAQVQAAAETLGVVRYIRMKLGLRFE